MERELWSPLYRLIEDVARHVTQKYVHHQPAVLLAVHLWAALNEKPAGWACDEANWVGITERPARLPSASTVARRKKRIGFQVAFQALTERLASAGSAAAVVSIDGKPLTVGGHSQDPDAMCGRAAGGMGKGYKFHAIWGKHVLPDVWEVTPLNHSECTVALELLSRLPERSGGYVLGDGGYNASKVFDAAAARGRQLLTPILNRGTPGGGHRYQSPHRWAGIRLMQRATGRRLYRQRMAIERRFAHLTSFAGGLQPLPVWVRGRRRVTQWVWAKLIINAVRILKKK